MQYNNIAGSMVAQSFYVSQTYFLKLIFREIGRETERDKHWFFCFHLFMQSGGSLVGLSP